MAPAKKIFVAVSFVCTLLILHFIVPKYFLRPSAVVTNFTFSKDRESGSLKLHFRVENRTDRLITPTILIRLRSERIKRFAPDPPPLYKNEIKVSLFPKEVRPLEHEIALAPGQKIASFVVREKRWSDF